MRDELLNGEIFYTLAEAPILIEAWRRHYNTVLLHSWLGYRPPVPDVATQQGCPPTPLRSTCGQPWRRRQSCTNNQSGPLSAGQSMRARCELDFRLRCP